ncbi:ABC transporter ATP-binding protein, partial [uncultured Prochlorococcus sp.]|uniref:ABC transporter ATP-binding protein n=2 Tax=uncultured Prochlorococcus sp. TaxID=159733 RepID=UPI00258DC972
MIKKEGSFKYLEIKNISKNFGETFVLKNIHLDVFKGEFLCLLGPSGCGKTTLLRIISGLERQTNGDIVQDGLLISNSPTEKRDFGIVFQSYALFPNLNAKQNIAYGLENKKINKKEIEKRTNNLLRLVGLEKYSDQFPSQLSGGQQQRVALARAMALSPGLLLLDEPLSALDAQVRSKLRNEIKLIQKKLNLTTIMVTHDQTEALSMADRVVVMERGHIAQIGTPFELYENPITPFVADFIGKMNLLKGKYDKKNCVFYYLNNRFLISQNTEYSFLENCLLGIRPEDIEIIKFR